MRLAIANFFYRYRWFNFRGPARLLIRAGPSFTSAVWGLQGKVRISSERSESPERDHHKTLNSLFLAPSPLEALTIVGAASWNTRSDSITHAHNGSSHRRERVPNWDCQFTKPASQDCRKERSGFHHHGAYLRSCERYWGKDICLYGLGRW
jgi:hypothetical protein